MWYQTWMSVCVERNCDRSETGGEREREGESWAWGGSACNHISLKFIIR